ncbi:MAG TPA: metallophosphoesterase [Bdellovibrionales bacterium]|nr:metallophosphoesterase [Bdellovibrionales bacterium]
MIRIAAVGDIHYDKGSGGRLTKFFTTLHESADLLLLAGDLTQVGTVDEISVLAKDLAVCEVPIVAVLGNHDYHADIPEKISEVLSEIGVTVLEGTSVTFGFGNYNVGIAGVKGFGGGFVGACGSDFGEHEMKAFVRFARKQADELKNALDGLDTDYKIALTHYSPIAETLLGEKKEIYPFLGSYLLAEAIDGGGADIAFHGHAHHGVEKGLTPGGIPVRNVAFPVIRHAFNIYTLNKEGLLDISAHPTSPAENEVRAAAR